MTVKVPTGVFAGITKVGTVVDARVRLGVDEYVNVVAGVMMPPHRLDVVNAVKVIGVVKEDNERKEKVL